MKKSRYIVLAAVIILLTSIALCAKKKPKVAVMEIEDRSKKFDATLMENAVDILRGTLSSTGRFIVIDKTNQQSKMKDAIKAGKKEAHDKCVGKDCQIPLGQSLSADNIIRSTISCLGKKCTLSTEMINIAKEATIAGSTSDFDGTAEGLSGAIKIVVRDLSDSAGGDAAAEEQDINAVYEEAKTADKNGQSEPAKALEAWKKLEDITENNPYKSLARNKAREWQSVINQRAQVENDRDNDIGKLIVMLPDMSIGFDTKKKAVVDYREKYSKTFGDDDIMNVIMTIGDAKLKERLVKELNGGGAAEEQQVDTGRDMATIPEGWFQMGCSSDKSDECEDDSRPLHKVFLNEYKIDKYEVTVEKYRACVSAGSCKEPGTERGCNYSAQTKEDHPVNCISWLDSADFCKWAGKRLPTEAEWEKAARGEQGIKYPWGNSPAVDCRYVIMDMGTEGCNKNSTWEITSKDRGLSPYGLYHMLGNVAEWVSDYYDKGVYSSASQKNPKGPSKGGEKVVRGGSYKTNSVARLQCFSREKQPPSKKSPEIGFRCAK